MQPCPPAQGGGHSSGRPKSIVRMEGASNLEQSLQAGRLWRLCCQGCHPPATTNQKAMQNPTRISALYHTRSWEKP